MNYNIYNWIASYYKFRLQLVFRKVLKKLKFGFKLRIEVSKTIALSKYKVLCKKKNFTFGIKNTLIEAALSNS